MRCAHCGKMIERIGGGTLAEFPAILPEVWLHEPPPSENGWMQECWADDLIFSWRVLGTLAEPEFGQVQVI